MSEMWAEVFPRVVKDAAGADWLHLLEHFFVGAPEKENNMLAV